MRAPATDRCVPLAAYSEVMAATMAVLWKHRGRAHSGSLELDTNRLELRTRGHTLSLPFDSVAGLTIERDPKSRLRGLPVLALTIRDFEQFQIASLQGLAALNELYGSLTAALPRA